MCWICCKLYSILRLFHLFSLIPVSFEDNLLLHLLLRKRACYIAVFNQQLKRQFFFNIEMFRPHPSIHPSITHLLYIWYICFAPSVSIQETFNFFHVIYQHLQKNILMEKSLLIFCIIQLFFKDMLIHANQACLLTYISALSSGRICDHPNPKEIQGEKMSCNYIFGMKFYSQWWFYDNDLI